MTDSLQSRSLWPLPGLGDRPWQRLLGLALLAAIAASRLLLLPDGPWEQDEAIFAAAVLDFDLPHHRPHPPGFPGWIAIGKLVAPLVGDGLTALRLASCFASLLGFVLLAQLLRRLVSPALALATALLHTFLPAVWFHAPRAFSSTPAITLALAALWAWTAGAGRRWLYLLGWLCLGAAATVRPQLAPSLGVVALLGIYLGRDRVRLAVAGAATALALVLAAGLVVAVDSGGLEALLAASRTHLSNSLEASEWPPTVAELGLVRGLGGGVPSLAWGLASVAGAAALIRRERALGLWLLALALVASASVLVLHPAAFPRYSVLPLCATAPLVACACALVPVRARALAPALLVAGTVASLATTLPAMLAAHRTPLPVIAALRELESSPERGAIAYSPGLFSFVRNERLHGRLHRRAHPLSAITTGRQAASRRFTLLTSDGSALPGATVSRRDYEDFPAVAWDLSQHRFHEAHVIGAPVLFPSGARAAVETNSRGEAFLWLTDEVLVLPQPGAEALVLALDVDEGRAPVELIARSRRRVLAREQLDAGARVVRLELGRCHSPCRLRLELLATRAPAGEGEGSSLRARVYGAWLEGPGFARTQPFTVSPGRPLEAMGYGVTFAGVFRAEQFTADRLAGAWTDGHATARFLGGAGELELVIAQPPPRAPEVTVTAGARPERLAAAASPTRHRLAAHPHEGEIELVLAGETHRPASDHPDSRDQRELGPILFELRFTPAEARPE